jgi:Dolichyl-phosphate-mannose-protein mannosyltransferase
VIPYLLAVAAASVSAWAIPDDAFVLVDIDRTTRALPGGLAIAARCAIATLGGAAASFVVWLSSGGALSRFGAALADWWREPASRWHVTVLAGLVAFGTWLRLASWHLPVSYDESISAVWFSSRSWLDVVSDHTIPNNHIFYNLLVRLLTSVVGISPEAIRAPALGAGLLCIPLTYWLVRRMWSGDAAIMAAGLATAAPMLVEYSTQGRGYTVLWMLFLSTCALATYVHERGPDTTRRWALFAVLTTLGFWAMPTMVYCTATIAIWLVLSAPRDARVRVVRELAFWGAVTGVLVALLYLPVLLRTGLTATPGPLANLWTYARLPMQWTAGLPLPFALLGLAGIAAAFADRATRPRVLVLLSAGLAAHVALLVIGKVPPGRVVYYQFFLVSAIACHGLCLLVARLRDNRVASPWIAIVLSPAVALAWGLARLDHARPTIDANGVQWVQGMAPGAEGVRCCADGYYVDAEALVETIVPNLADGDAIVTRDFNGCVETMRFYLVADGRTPVDVHPYRPERGLDQLAPYGDVFVVVKSEEHVPPQDDYRATVLPLLGVQDDELRRVYREPVSHSTHRISRVYRMARREPRATRAPGEKVPFNMFWYW